MEAVVLLRDCISHGNLEENIVFNEEEKTLYFQVHTNKSKIFNIDTPTKLLSPSQQCYTLQQLYVFAKYYVKSRDWSDYSIACYEFGDHTGDVQIDNEDEIPLLEYLNGNNHTFNGITVPTSTPKPLSFTTHSIENNSISNNTNDDHMDNKKRKLDDNDNNSNNYPSNKRQKTSHISSLSDNANNNHNNNALLFDDKTLITSNNQSSSLYDNQPFWRTLPDPKPKTEEHDSVYIDWKKDYRSRIRESATRNTILNSSNNKSFDEVAGFFRKISGQIQKLQQSGNTPKPKHVFVQSREEQRLKQCVEKPIIIVPNSNNSLITFSNCIDFLFNNKYHPSSANNNNVYSSLNNNKKDGHVQQNENKLIYSKPAKLCKNTANARLAEFEIRSSSSFGRSTPISDWNRIAAIFVIGKPWQFRKWKEGWRRPEQIFDNAVGFYLHFAMDPPKGDVLKWRVKTLPIQRNLRHNDARITHEFWKILYSHLASKHRNKKLYY